MRSSCLPSLFLVSLLAAPFATGCAAESQSGGTTGDDQNISNDDEHPDLPGGSYVTSNTTLLAGQATKLTIAPVERPTSGTFSAEITTANCTPNTSACKVKSLSGKYTVFRGGDSYGMLLQTLVLSDASGAKLASFELRVQSYAGKVEGGPRQFIYELVGPGVSRGRDAQINEIVPVGKRP